MLDYEAIAALAAVLETQSFQQAAQKLFLTQSAISQRLKSLENYYGEPVLIRSLPYQPTALGLMLLGHFKRVSLLEESLQSELTGEAHTSAISIAISRDSLETWFVPILNHLHSIMPIKLEIIADDQEHTLSYLQKGLVAACASTAPKALTNCNATFLGYLDYVLVASPEFKQRYFKNENSFKQNLSDAPFINFDKNDTLHKDYLKQIFHITDASTNYHVIPSVAGFKQMTLNGYAYSLIPEIDIRRELEQKKLVHLCKDKTWQMPMYWHRWAIENIAYKKFNQLVLKTAQKILRQK